jgi:formate transporter
VPEVFGSDAYAPKQIAERVQSVGVAKAGLPLLSMIALGILAGGFIGLGALYYTVVTSDASLGYAAARVLGGIAFSLGLILVVIAGAELFTGNNLMVMAWVSQKITFRRMLRNLAIVYGANLIGAAGLALIVALSGHWKANGGAVGEHAMAIAEGKVALPFMEAFFKGVLCNILVCLAIWLAMAARTVSGKILAIVFPISAFVAAGFEHCVANMYFIPLGLLLDAFGYVEARPSLTWLGMANNLIPVTLGNVAGGAGMVGLVYYVIYVHHERSQEKP